MRYLFLILLFAQLLLSCNSKNEKVDKPNVLLILADDLGYHDLTCYGLKDFETPNLDRIATAGVRFTAGYVTAPQCGPSRAGLMTGMSQARFGVTDNKKDFGLPSREVVELLPEQMKSQGYVTGMIGKWHIGFRYDPKDRSKSAARPGHEPWERGFDYVCKIHSGGSDYFPYATPGLMGRDGMPKHLREKREDSAEPAYLSDLPENSYLTDVFTDRGIDFIQRNNDEPWFLYLAYNAPHSPMQPKPDKFEKYAYIKNDRRRKFAGMMESLDEGVGKILDILEQTGQLENTVVWFLSDNGGVSLTNPRWNGSRNNPFSGAKGDVFEGGIRIPFMVSWPGKLPAGKVVSDPVTALDILPTCVAAAGKEQVAEIHEGRNLLPWLKEDADYPARDLFWTWRGNFNAIRSGTLKEIRNGRPVKTIDGTEIPEHNFVDLATNPTELAGEHALQNPDKKQQLATQLDAWLEKLQQDAEKLTPLDEY